MTDSKHPTFDSLMDKAYENWQKEGVTTMADFWATLNPAQRAAVFLGNMNYQVENGGWSQWGPTCNNYGTPETYNDIHTYLTQIGTETALKARTILDEVWSIFQGEVDPEPGEDDWDQSELFAELHEYDGPYYDINSQLLDDIEEWLKKNFKAD